MRLPFVLLVLVGCLDPNTQEPVAGQSVTPDLGGTGSANALAVWTDGSDIGTSTAVEVPSTGQIGLNHTPSTTLGGMVDVLTNTNLKAFLAAQFNSTALAGEFTV